MLVQTTRADWPHGPPLTLLLGCTVGLPEDLPSRCRECRLPVGSCDCLIGVDGLLGPTLLGSVLGQVRAQSFSALLEPV